MRERRGEGGEKEEEINQYLKIPRNLERAQDLPPPPDSSHGPWPQARLSQWIQDTKEEELDYWPKIRQA